MKPKYQAETIGSIMTEAVPTCLPTATRKEVVDKLVGNLWEDVHYIYVVDESRKLLGWVLISNLVQQPGERPVGEFMQRADARMLPTEDQERAVFVAVKNDLDSVPVVDSEGKLLGAVVARSIIDVLHTEHIEDALLSVGIRSGKGVNIVRLARDRLMPVFMARLPWLVVGALVGILLGFVSSWFENSLQRTLELAYFVPVVAYIADSVGTQSEAITIRALAVLQLSYIGYLLRELVIGFALGLVLGTIGAIGAFMVSQDLAVASVVGIALLIASTLATGLAAFIPITFKLFGKDPALGSGPLATALQDVLSIVIYFVVALLIIH